MCYSRKNGTISPDLSSIFIYLFHAWFLFHMPDTCRMADLLLLANNPNITLTPGFPA